MPDKLRIIDLLYQQLLATLAVERSVMLATLKEESEMDQTLTELLARLDASTNKIAAKIQKLIDAAAAAGSATSAEISAALTPVVTQLEAMGADPADPVPGP